MPEMPLVTIPLEIDAKLLERIKATAASVAPGKRGKLVASLDLNGNLSVGLGARVAGRVTVGAVLVRDAQGRQQGGVQASVEWAPAP